MISTATGIEACQACHGVRGEGNPAVNAPPLAGQRRDYLQRQIANFRDGRRGADPLDANGAVMRAQALTFDPADDARLADIFAKMPVTRAKAGAGDATRGRQRFRSECADCHGLRGEGYAQLGTPDLRLHDAAYLVAQLEAFRRGWRGASVAAGSSDPYGEWMRAVAWTITDPRDPADIQAYLAALR
jgi:cytochrome c553